MTFTKDQLKGLARKPRCPRCDLNKTVGNALCSSCRAKLPANMREQLEKVGEKEPWHVGHALRQAANYFNDHCKAVGNWGGGTMR